MPTNDFCLHAPPSPQPQAILNCKGEEECSTFLFTPSPPKSMGSINVEGITDTGQQMHASSFKQCVLFSVFYDVLTSWGLADHGSHRPHPIPKW